jgi:hypothetical protein
MLQTRALVVTVCLSGLLACSGSSPRGGGSGGDSDTGGAGDTGGSPGTGGRAATGGSPGTGGSTSTGGKGDTGGAGGDTGGAGGSDTGGKGGGSGGAGTGGAKPDGGAADGPPSSSGAGCKGVTAKFCSDFDDQMNGMEPKGPFTLNKGGYATMTVDTGKKYSGAQSLHIALNNSPDSGHARLQFAAPLLPLPSNDIHGRLMIFLDRNVKNHWDLVTAFASTSINDSESVTQDTFGSYGSDGHIESVHQPGDDSVDSTTKFPVGKWACLQWEFKGTPGMPHVITVKLDGQFIDKGMTLAKASWKPATWNSMGIGWINFEGGVSGTINMWIDDLAFGEQEIPCPPAP